MKNRNLYDELIDFIIDYRDKENKEKGLEMEPLNNGHLSARIGEELKERMINYAKMKGVTLSGLTRNIISEYFGNGDDIETVCATPWNSQRESMKY